MGLVDEFKRWRLVQQGLSSGKKRRTSEEGGMFWFLSRSALVRGGIYAASAAMLAAVLWKCPGMEEMGSVLLLSITAVLLICAVAIFQLNHHRSANKNGSVLLVFGGIIFHLWLLRLAGGLISTEESALSFLLMPLALAPMIHSVLLGQRMGVYSAVFTSLFGALMFIPESRLIFFVISLFCGLVAVFGTRRVRRRGKLLRAGFYVGVAALLLEVLFGQISVHGLSEPGALKEFGQACLMALGVGLATGLVVGGILPILESIFGLTTEISWLELSDLNHPLLKRMQLEAPGTFHHSLIVAALSESAAEAVGADALQTRVCAYFHDIGKLRKPEYFIENQGDGNPHDALTPTMSALIIIAHVKDGVDLAIKNKLNPAIIQVIQEHHGDSLVYYFYRKAQERLQAEQAKGDEESKNSDDLPKVDEKSFRYPGSIPQSRECGIISLADAVESASRTLSKPTPKKIRGLVNEIVLKRIRDGQLDACGLTLSELTEIRDVFSKTLRSILHSRIEYPKEKVEVPMSDLKDEMAKVGSIDSIERLRRQRQ
ncbi:HDIG domain-containing protein [Akkermansiaceae bacterium]|nr:HDIG domain-containing protein [Akkermansiaceae bacterium]